MFTSFCLTVVKHSAGNEILNISSSYSPKKFGHFPPLCMRARLIKRFPQDVCLISSNLLVLSNEL